MTPTAVRSIELGITNKCTLRCPHCDSITMGLPTARPIHLDVNALMLFMDDLPNLETVLIEGAYSDQLMHPHLLDVVKYCKNRRLKIRFCTHGSARSADWWRQLGRLLDQNDIVRFAIDGSTQQLHSTYRVNSSLDTVLANHATLKRCSEVKTSLQHIVFEYNKYDTDNVVQLAKIEGFDWCEIIQCGNVTLTPATIKSGIVPIAELASVYARNDRIIKSFTSPGEVICDSVIRSEIYINHRGEISMCADHDTTQTKPNIFTHTTSELFDYMNKNTDKRICFKFCNKLEYNIGTTFPTIVHGNGVHEVKFHTRELS